MNPHPQPLPARVTIGTRGSKLALWQAHHIRDRLLASGVAEVELLIIKTTGDRIQDVALSEVGGKGLFVKEIEEALLDGRVDLAVHSMKDMPSALPDGLVLGAVPERESPLDAWVLPDGRPAGADFLAEVPEGALIGTSSLRRVAQLRMVRPDLRFTALRGNVDTRLRKLDEREGGLFAIVLACAGLNRLGLAHRISAPIPADLMVPAVGQGALAIEVRAANPAIHAAMATLEHAPTRVTTTAERALLAALEGNCQVPIGAHATLVGEVVEITGFFGDEGGHVARAELAGPKTAAAELGQALAAALRARLLAPGVAALGEST